MRASWQGQTIEVLRKLTENDSGVCALIVFGSMAGNRDVQDEWSDVDVLLVVRDSEVTRFWPSTTWLESAGDIYAMNQSSDEYRSTTRIVFADLRRVDVAIASETAMARVSEWPRNPLLGPVRVVFSRSPVIDHDMGLTFEPRPAAVPSDESSDEMANAFRFKAMLAVQKVVRHDLLIALHLALDLVRDCCVLGMMLRDRSTGTSYHRSGGAGNHLVRQLDAWRTPYSAEGILESIQRSALTFDALAERWQPTARDGSGPVIEAAQRAQNTVRRS